MMTDNKNTLPKEDTELTANALKAMAHPLRWRILCVLGEDEMTVSELVRQIGTSQSNISQHLELLKRKNILISRRDANRVFYRIRNNQLLLLIGNMSEVLCKTNLE